jgi:hypothetical protein
MENKKNFLFLGFLCALSIGGAALVYLTTSRIGPGVAADGTTYLSVAANLLKGRGLIDLYGGVLVQFPPLYPALIASVSWLTRADIFIVGWYINIISFGLIVFFSGILILKTYPDRMLFAYIGSIFIATSLTLIDTSASILSDPLFMLFVVLYLWVATYFTQTQNVKYLIWMGLLACLASLERYAGLALVLAGVIYLLYFYWGNFRRGLFRTGLFAVSGLPVFLWGILHNYPVNRQLFGSRLRAILTINLYLTGEKIFYWFLPYKVMQLVTPIGLLALGLLMLILLNRASHWKNWFRRLAGKSEAMNSIFVIVYLCLLIFYTSSYETDDIWFQRFHVILLPSLLILLFAIYEELIPPRLGTSALKFKDGILIAVFILWLIYPFLNIQAYEQAVQINGEIANNSYNYVDIRESDFLKMAENLSVSQRIYSNYEPAAWFYLRRDILSIPRVDPKSRQFNSDSLTNFRNLTGSSGGAYLVWFKTINYRDNLPSLNQLNQAIKMKLIFTSDVGDIYYIASNTP